MKKQFVAFMAILGVSATLVGCSSPKTATTPSEEITVENSTSEESAETTTPEDETTENEDSSITEGSEDAAVTLPTEAPSLETEQTEEKVESEPEQISKPNTSTSKPSATTKPQSGITTKPQATTKPEATTKPQASTKPEANTKPQATTKPEASTKPEVSTKPEASTKPEISTKPEVTPTPETTSLSSSEVFSQITSGLELPTQTELDADLLMNLYGIDEGLLESYCVKMPMMSFQITEIGVFKVKDANTIDSIVAGINKRAGAVGTMLYPSLQETFDSRVVTTKGNYILFAMDENASTIAANFNNLIK